MGRRRRAAEDVQIAYGSLATGLGLEQVRDAQADVESGATPGKHVVVLND
ncbi:hypothetical protein RND61_09755 [Streptomyces sp. TRM76323]|uniref:Uncharacterized protein n=1 Tax=Streptomyces tamarix TaxID=3078565 RepID=A0ABU3QHV2_9ACTN|nr:hypothetical protein [Streptomyces tamarix]MDT9682355.1 hypothetical protein [Streptomyces tamarix]